MKIHIKYLKLAVFLMVAIQAFTFYMIFKTHQLNQEINIEIESLRQLLHRYDSIHLQYDSAYHQLVHTRQRLVGLEDYYNKQLTVQQAELDDILHQLHDLSKYRRYHRRYSYPVVVHPVDSLIFAP